MKGLKQWIQRLLPAPVLQAIFRRKRNHEQRLNASKSAEEVFSSIYESQAWGGENDEYNSGGGSFDEEIGDAYVGMIEDLAGKLGFDSLRAVDLGCGDMRIGQRLIPLFAKYTGADVVKGLVERHQEKLGDGERVRFMHLDITEQPLPEGDVCMVRQVFQHLSNDQIRAVLPKLAQYRYLLVTEHHPDPGSEIRKNVDMVHGGSTRIFDNSGVYLTGEPFCVPQNSAEVVLEVKGRRRDDVPGHRRGIIQTLLLRPAAGDWPQVPGGSSASGVS